MKNFWTKFISISLAVLVCVALVLVFNSETHMPRRMVMFGNCTWVIDDNGVLTISPIDDTDGQLPDSSNTGTGKARNMVIRQLRLLLLIQA